MENFTQLFHGLITKNQAEKFEENRDDFGPVLRTDNDTLTVLHTYGEGVSQPGICKSALVGEKIVHEAVDMTKIRRQLEDCLRKDKFFLYEIAKQAISSGKIKA